MEREELEDILDQPEYQIYYEDNRNFLEVWWDQLKNWFHDLLSDILPSLEPTQGVASIILMVLIGIVVVLIGFVVFLAFRKGRRSRTFRDYQPLQSMNEKDWTYHDHLTEARKQENSENYTGATRHMFLALLFYFHAKNWLIVRNWKTNGEYVAELKEVNQQIADPFYHLALVFDQVVYGERHLQKSEYIPFRDEIMGWLTEDIGERHTKD
ncbi:DUF4129 domain-containing protein [Virgibacillus sp. NKC19-3]|uniref:DUF4129 domain-containing protein n=1 Tax=Virgibacillus saliphilus TaxID=2831674 RepID=UPI001C9B6502|nr:DUF4129 domain-containing protein [Virgibacillus sp. NKC19-3]MBY7141539.1 DUF4129 domain-containing protein [Virgibacillus sp. NKC19-3]